jgi:NAD(P)-dependent dehydrogenase (short-subunit alcohol dehydrogenase family)
VAFATYPSLGGKVVFVTGGASGIGAAFVEAFHGQGARVAFVDIDEAASRALAERLGVMGWVADVRDAAALEASLAQAASALGPIEVLINNVANDTRHSPEVMDAAGWRASLAVNLDPAFIASRAVQPAMAAAGGGVILNLGSVTALIGPADLPAYVAAKAAIPGLTRSLARAWGKDRIRVNAIIPGWIVTERQLDLWLNEASEAAWMAQTALKDRILPNDVARLALFLASDDARMITGQSYVIDGGRT